MSNFNFIGNFLGKSAKPAKDGHDMSSQHAYSLNFGTINVVDVLDVVPGEHYKCKYSGAVQTAPMREDNFATIYNNMRAVFVPYTSLLRGYMDNINDTSRPTRKNTIFQYRPKQAFVSQLDILYYIWPSYFLFSALKVFKEYGVTAVEFNTADGFLVFTDGSVPVSLTGRGQVVLKWFNEVFSASSVSFVKVSFASFCEFILYPCRSQSGNLICFDALRVLDFLGYGNFIPTLESSFSRFIEMENSNNLGRDVRVSIFSVSGVDVGFIYSFSFNAPHTGSPYSALIRPRGINVSLDRLFAFQYYIYSCEMSNYRSPLIQLYTMDSMSVDASLSSFVFTEDHGTYLKFKFDFDDSFTTYVNTEDLNDGYQTYSIGVNINLSHLLLAKHQNNFMTLPISVTDLFGYLFSLSNPLLFQDLFTTMQINKVSGSIPTTDVSNLTTNLVQNIADVSALYKFRQDLLRAGVKRDSQMKSVYGVSPDDTLTDDIYILDKSSSVVNIQGLLNQAETSEAPLGARAARGNGQSGLSFDFDSKDFGFIFIIQYFTCELFYESFMIDRLNRTLLADYFKPQFNYLGLEAVKRYDCSNQHLAYAYYGSDSTWFPDGDKVLGYSSRYWMYKQRLSKVHGLFTNFGFSIPIDSVTGVTHRYESPTLMRGNSLFGGFLPTLIDQQINFFESRNDLYFNPFMVNNLFVTMNDGGLFGSFDYDQFRCVLDCQVHKVSPMPKLGLLRLDV